VDKEKKEDGKGQILRLRHKGVSVQ